jgi:hypothetical protein
MEDDEQPEMDVIRTASVWTSPESIAIYPDFKGMMNPVLREAGETFPDWIFGWASDKDMEQCIRNYPACFKSGVLHCLMLEDLLEFMDNDERCAGLVIFKPDFTVLDRFYPRTRA